MRICLVLIVIVASSTASAITLDLDNPSGIAAMYVVGDMSSFTATIIVCTDGSGWKCTGEICNTWTPLSAAPVPLAQVADWTPWVVYTTDGKWFIRSAPDDQIRWEQMGVDPGNPPPCFGAVGSTGTSLGKVKSLFR